MPTLQLSATTDLDPAGATIAVDGSGYDESRGIYLAFCVVPPPGMTPTPCGGGVDLSGDSSASQWISSNPPDYGDGLVVPYGPGGTFSLQITVNALLRPDIDCRLVQCAVVTRADHTNITDRSLDVIVPVFFAAEPGAAPTTSLVAAVPGVASTIVAADPSAAPTLPAAGDGSAAANVPVDAVVIDPTLTAPRGSASLLPMWVAVAVITAALLWTSPRRRARTAAVATHPPEVSQ